MRLKENMNKNPLTTTIIVIAIMDAYTVWEAISNGEVSVLTGAVLLQGVVLLVLYLKKSRIAGSYLFYSIIPIFPIFFGLKYLGLNPPPVSSEVYLIAFLIYVVAAALLWKQKRDYDRYIEAEYESAPPVS
jgi:hypothetical protein